MQEEIHNNCPDNHLVWAILCTLLCCLPLGIVAIVKAVSVEKLWYQGRHDEAVKAAQAAKNFSIWGAVLAVVGIILYVILVGGMVWMSFLPV